MTSSMTIRDELAEAAMFVASAEQVLDDAKQERDELIVTASIGGLSLRTIADLVGVSHQTVANVVAARAATTTSQPVPPVE
jgi:DNA-directed RNA polymerase specialized sigma24 family protein